MHSKGGPRRRHSTEFKQQVIAACAEPEASVAAVARSFGLNDNLVHQWRRGRGLGGPRSASVLASGSSARFVALSLPSPMSPPPTPAPAREGIRIELERGTLGINVIWPLTAAVECSAWLRELLR